MDRIKRYGGTTSSEKPWPEEPEAVTDEERPELQAGCGLAVAWLWLGCGLAVAWLWLCGLAVTA